MALDVGEKRIGIALSDPMKLIASPLTVIPGTEEKTTVGTILELTRQHQVERIVMGLPRSLSGGIGPQAQRVQQFGEELSRHTRIPVVYWDERLSTIAADKVMAAALIKRESRKARRDAIAAAFILQGYLDAANNSS
jgi:putative Holliday junction resolvase